MKIAIVDYDPEWVSGFDSEKNKIQNALASLNPVIEHIGSTSVPGLGAKPIIDMLVGLRSEAELEQCIEPMIAAGYTYYKIYDPIVPYRKVFQKLISIDKIIIPFIVDLDDTIPDEPDFERKVNIHIMERNTEHWHRHLAFRDYLRIHKDVKEEYFRLKKRLSEIDWKSRTEYTDAKNEFIQKVQKDALAWYSKQNRS